jgi:sugar fermentation stimulation protein A
MKAKIGDERAMTYPSIIPAIFRARPNRFVAEVEIDGRASNRAELVHVKNTGRCAELLVPGALVYLNKAANTNRATKYDLVAVQKGARLINMDSYAPNIAFGEYLQSGRHIDGVTLIKPEAKYGKSRFDFYVETGDCRSGLVRKIFIEVKGVTLEDSGAVMFPDAPTERGVKHLNELAASIRDGYEAHIVFVIQMTGVLYFTPNEKTHPAFGDALRAAKSAGVTVTALDCEITPSSMVIGKPVAMNL